MTLDAWLQAATVDAECRGLPEVVPLLASLAPSLTTLRAAAWLLRADGQPARDGLVNWWHKAAEPDGALPARTQGVRDRSQSIRALAHDLRSGRITARSLLEDTLDRIHETQPDLNAFITVLADEARHEAERRDAELQAGRDRGWLHGLPISVKDLIDIDGATTTAASHLRRDHLATHDAACVTALRDAGAILIGKTNLHEFAFGTTNEDSAFGPVRHPLDHARWPGGSSGGSAAAIAAGIGVASIGTDTGGSIRIPSATCGIVGLKPTFDEVSTSGVVPLGATLDHVGPIARSVDDAAIVFDALCGRPGAVSDDGDEVPGDLRGLKFARLRGYFEQRLDTAVRLAYRQAVDALVRAGAQVYDVQLGYAAEIAPVYLATVLAEAAAYHAETLAARPGDYTPNVRVRLEMCRYILGEDYVRAQQGRAVFRREVDQVIEQIGPIILPTVPIPAQPLGTTTIDIDGKPDSVRNLTLRLTQLFNLTGHPAITMPCGMAEGLPVGLQVVGARERTRALIDLARRIEPIVAP